MLKRSSSNTWLADIQPGGRGRARFRKTFSTKAEALRWIQWVEDKVAEDPQWSPPKRDQRRLAALVDIWYQAHGRTLKDGESRRRWLVQIAQEMGDPSAGAFSAATFIAWRSQRLEAGNTPATVNNALAYMRALFRELERIEEWKRDNPLGKVRRIPNKPAELTFLNDSELLALFESLEESSNRDVFLCAALAVSTGARWSEAEGVTWERVAPGLVMYHDTKNGSSRALPLTGCLAASLEARRPPEGSGRVFRSCYSAFRSAVERAGLELPKGQLSHVLRHTFASRFMQNGGNILTLQRALGHSSLQMTMRYAHLAPDHLEELRRNNPLCG